MRFLADENFNNKILTGLRVALPDIDILRVVDTEMYQSPDPELLEWAAQQGRILLTHDVQTLAGFANERVKAGLFMPGVIEVRMSQKLGSIIEELAIMIGASPAEEFENLVRYIPMH